MTTPTDHSTPIPHPVSPAQESPATSYLGRPGGRIGYDVAGRGPLVMLVPGDFGEYRDRVVASLRRPGYAGAFSRTTRTSHAAAAARLTDVTGPVLVVMGERDPDFPDPRAEADWIARALRAQVVMVAEAGHYPQSQQPDLTADAILPFLAGTR